MTAQRSELRAQRIPPPGGMLPPDDDHIAIWWTTTDVSAGVLESLRADLDGDTLARVNAMVREEDRQRGIIAHGMLRRLVAACIGLAPRAVTIDRSCASCGDADHGKPSLATHHGTTRPPLQFNLAHSGGVVAVALAGPDIDVGIDVEAIRTPYDWTSARRHVFTDAEWQDTSAAEDPNAERFTLWARKEAAAKTTGHGLAIDLSHVEIDEGSQRGAFWTGHLTAPERRYDLLVADLPIGAGTAAAVALTSTEPGAEPPAVRLTRADLTV